MGAQLQASLIRRGYIAAAGGQLHYREAGDASKPCLLMLHQSPSSSVMYEALMRELCDDYYCLALDTPGFGQSDSLAMASNAVSIAAYAEVLLAGIKALGIKQCHGFGHHTGASVLVQMADLAPGLFTAMALSGPTLLSEQLKAILPSKGTAFPLAEDGSHLLGMWQRMRAKEPDADMQLSMRETLLGLAVGDAYPEAYQAVVEQDFETQLRNFAGPVLVFAGDKDPLYPQLDAAFACLQQGQKAVLPGAATYACDREVGSIADLLRGFYG